jgi:hypothetical protein
VTSPPTAQAQRLFDGKIDYGNTRNIYPVIPELEAVMHSPRVAGALASLLGPGYVMDRRKHMHNSSSQVRPARPPAWAARRPAACCLGRSHHPY